MQVKRLHLLVLYVMCDSPKISSCCFICRQVLIEFFDQDAKVYLYTKEKMESYTLKELTPVMFNEDNL